MNLKKLALLACLAQATQIVLGFCYAASGHYLGGRVIFQEVLSLPLLFFFFYVWRHQKP